MTNSLPWTKMEAMAHENRWFIYQKWVDFPVRYVSHNQMVPDGTYRWCTIGHPPEVMGTYGNIGNSSKEMLMKRWRFHGCLDMIRWNSLW